MSSLKFCRVVKIIKIQFHFYPAICEEGFILQSVDQDQPT